MDFWSSVNMAMLAMLHDHNRELDRRADYYQKCREKISDDACEMTDLITTVFENTNTNIVPNLIWDGMKLLPLYAGYLVLRAQGGRPTREQDIMVDLFYKHLHPPISKSTFLSAARSGSGAEPLEKLVGLSDTQAGTFWRTFFKAVYISDSKSLSTFLQLFCDMVMRFSVIGNPQSQVALPVCERFLNASHKQADAVVNGPEDELDLMGEIPYREHKDRAIRLANDLAQLAGVTDQLDMDALMPLFLIATLYELLEHASGGVNAKAQMMEYIMQEGDLRHEGLSGAELYSHITARDELFQFMCSLSENMPLVLVDVAQKAERKDMMTRVLLECGGFLIGAEGAISRTFPGCGLGNYASKYWEDSMDNLYRQITE